MVVPSCTTLTLAFPLLPSPPPLLSRPLPPPPPHLFRSVLPCFQAFRWTSSLAWRFWVTDAVEFDSDDERCASPCSAILSPPRPASPLDGCPPYDSAPNLAGLTDGDSGGIGWTHMYHADPLPSAPVHLSRPNEIGRPLCRSLGTRPAPAARSSPRSRRPRAWLARWWTFIRSQSPLPPPYSNDYMDGSAVRHQDRE